MKAHQVLGVVAIALTILAGCGDGDGSADAGESIPVVITFDGSRELDAVVPDDAGRPDLADADSRLDAGVEDAGQKSDTSEMSHPDSDHDPLDPDRFTRVIPDTGATTNGWRWMHPLPQGNALNGVWGTGPADVVAVGDGGTIVEWDGSAFAVENGVTSNNLNGVWGVASERWAVGDGGTFLRGDGATWSSEDIGTTDDLVAVWGSSPDDIWVCLSSDGFQHWDGSTWSHITVPGQIVQMFGIWGSAPDDVWAVGQVGKTAHWDGQTWTAHNPFRDFRPLNDVWGAGQDDVWAVGYGIPPVVRWSGTDWNEWNPAGTPPKPDTVDKSNGEAIWGSSADDIWLSGRGDSMAHWDGAEWFVHITYNSAEIEDIWGSGPDDVFAVGETGAVNHWDGVNWNALSDRAGRGWAADSVSGQIWFVGQAGSVLHWDGSDLTYYRHSTRDLVDVWAGSVDDVWAVGREGTLLHWDGVDWTRVEPPPSRDDYMWMKGVWGSASDDVWAVGKSGLVWHWDGTSWTEIPIGTTHDLFGIHGFAEDDIWVSAIDMSVFPAEGALYHYDGSTWSTVDTGTTKVLSEVWGATPDDLWAVGSGIVMRYDGTDWVPFMEGPDIPNFGPMWGRAADEAWSVARDGEVWRWDGTDFAPIPSPDVDWRNGRVVGTATELWVLGPGGALLRRN